MSLKTLFGSALKAQRSYLFAIHAHGHKKYVSETRQELFKRKEEYEFAKQTSSPTPRSSHLEWNYDAELYSFGKRLGEHIEHTLLAQALTQRSFIIQEEEKQKSVGIEQPLLDVTENTPLVEQGKGFTSRYVKQYLRVVLPYLPEEGIESVHDFLLSASVLAHISNNIGMNDLVQTVEYPITESSLQSCFFALVQAIYQSSDSISAGNFVRDFVITQLAGRSVSDIWEIPEPVEKLQAIYKNHGKKEPEPRLIGSAGPNTLLANYRIAFYNAEKQLVGLGFGESIEIAKDMAARDALRRIFRITEHDAPVRYNLVLENEEGHKVNPSLNEWNESKLLRATG